MGDGEADARETGFSTTFDGDSNFFYVFEAGVAPQIPSTNGPLQGTYRFGIWIDHQDKMKFAGGTESSETGLYVSCDQVVWLENSDEEDTQGLGAFFRWGIADDDVSDIKSFWSAGLQYQGPIPGRDDDVIGLGYARGELSSGAGYSASHESVTELYYNAQVTPWLSISPSVQHVQNPGGDKTVGDAVVGGVRGQLGF